MVILIFTLISFFLQATGKQVYGWCGGHLATMLCADGTTCDCDVEGWECCKPKGGRLTGTADYPFLCATKIPFGSWMDPPDSNTSALENPAVCASGDYDFCAHPVKDSPEKCDVSWSSSVAGLSSPQSVRLGGVQSCALHGNQALVADWCAGKLSTMLCKDGTTCDAATEGWSCCKAKGGRASGTADYPYMCRQMIPFGSWMDPPNSNTAALANPAVCDAEVPPDFCTHPVKNNPMSCYVDWNSSVVPEPKNSIDLGGVQSCAFDTGFVGTHTCGAIKTAYRKNQCCGSPSRMFKLA